MGKFSFSSQLLTKTSFLTLLIGCVFVFFNVVNVYSQTDQTAGKSEQEKRKKRANQNIVKIISGGSSRSQLQITADLIDVLNKTEKKKQTLRVISILGLGGKQNIEDILFLNGADMALIQMDTISYLRKKSPKQYKNITNQIRYITKLHNSEWQVIANQKIKSLKDLEGKTVNISKKYSGTYITSQMILELVGVKVNFTTYDDNIAINKLQAGELDAVTIISGAPNERVQKIKNNDGLHIVPVDFHTLSKNEASHKLLQEFSYLPTKLTHKNYPNLIPYAESVPTIAIGTILAVYNWPQNSARYPRVSKFIKDFFNNFDKFREAGRHPKWKEVNLFAKIPNMKRFSAAEKILQKYIAHKKTTKKPLKVKNPKLLEKFMDFVAVKKYGLKNHKQLTSSQRKQLRKEYLKITQDASKGS